MPLLETLEICLHELYHTDLPISSINQEELRRLLLLAASDVEFNFDGTTYIQIDGVAMGSPLGPMLANIFVGYYELKVLYPYVPQPCVYCNFFEAAHGAAGAAIAALGRPILCVSNPRLFASATNRKHKHYVQR